MFFRTKNLLRHVGSVQRRRLAVPPHIDSHVIRNDVNSCEVIKPAPVMKKRQRKGDPKGMSDEWDRTPFAKLACLGLNLKDFDEVEVGRSFKEIAVNEDFIPSHKLRQVLKSRFNEINEKMYKKTANDLQIDSYVDRVSQIFPSDKSGKINQTDFVAAVGKLVNEVDSNVKTMTYMYLAIGTSVGIVLPILPQLATTLPLNSAQYGSIIAGFALSKLFFNLPSAKLINRYGKKPLLVAGIGVLALANVQLAFLMYYVPSYEALIFSRVFTGIAVSFFSSAATGYLADISTSKNRGRTIAPPMTAFSLGASIGPALGGFLCSNFSIPATFGISGGCFSLVALIAYRVIKEPYLPEYATPTTAGEGKVQQKEDHVPLYKMPDAMAVIGMNGVYWFVLSGSQMTLFPLILSDPAGFNLGADQVGYALAATSFVAVIGTPLAGKLVDRYTPLRTIFPATALVGCAMSAAAMETNLQMFIPAVLTWVLCGTVLSSAPTAFISERVPQAQRISSLAWLRTAGDIGLLTGSLSAGVLADVFTKSEAMLGNGVGLVCIAGATSYRIRNSFKR